MEEKYRCEECEMDFDSKESLKAHQKQEHDSKKSSNKPKGMDEEMGPMEESDSDLTGPDTPNSDYRGPRSVKQSQEA